MIFGIIFVMLAFHLYHVQMSGCDLNQATLEIRFLRYHSHTIKNFFKRSPICHLRSAEKLNRCVEVWEGLFEVNLGQYSVKNDDHLPRVRCTDRCVTFLSEENADMTEKMFECPMKALEFSSGIAETLPNFYISRGTGKNSYFLLRNVKADLNEWAYWLKTKARPCDTLIEPKHVMETKLPVQTDNHIIDAHSPAEFTLKSAEFAHKPASKAEHNVKSTRPHSVGETDTHANVHPQPASEPKSAERNRRKKVHPVQKSASEKKVQLVGYVFGVKEGYKAPFFIR